MDPDMYIIELEEAMEKTCEYTIHEFAGIRTGKASPSMVENMEVEISAYGSTMKLKQLANISTPEPRLITVTPFDPSTAKDIERAIRTSNLGINPNADGRTIRLPVPELTAERRKQLVKVVKDMAETGKVRVRGQRSDARDAVKKAEKDGKITEDDMGRMEDEIQKLTDRFVKEIDVHVQKKEAEILQV